MLRLASRPRTSLRSVLAGAAVTAVLLPAGVSSAATSSPVGLAPALLTDNGNFGGGWYGGVATGIVAANTGSAERATAGGILTQWQVRPRMAGGTLRVIVLRPDGPGYRITAIGSPETMTGPGVHTFGSSLPIEAGDVIGLIGTSNGLRQSNVGLGPTHVATTWVGAGSTVGATLSGSPFLEPGNPYALSGTVSTEEATVTPPPVDAAPPPVVAPPADAAPAPAPAPVRPALVSVATRTQAGGVTIARRARTLRVACGVDRGAIHACSVRLLHAGRVVGTGSWSRTRQTASAGVMVTLTREGLRLARLGTARVTVRVTTEVAGRTLRGSRQATLASR